MVSFIDFYFHFLANIKTLTLPHMFSIRNPYMTQTVSPGYLCSLILPFDQGILLCDSSIEKSGHYSQGTSKYGITNVFTLSCVLLSKHHCLWCEYNLKGQEIPRGVLQERNHLRYHCTISVQCPLPRGSPARYAMHDKIVLTTKGACKGENNSFYWCVIAIKFKLSTSKCCLLPKCFWLH